jgi:uncharacterized protein (DUF1330 family)
MSALMIARITVKDPGKLQEYLEKTQKLAAQYGAELQYRGKAARELSGSDKHAMLIIVKFPSIEKLNEWHDSDAYQPLKALRKEGADMQMTSYEVQ